MSHFDNLVKQQRGETMDFKVNANQIVKVKLTNFGIQILHERHQELQEEIKSLNGKGLDPFVLITDEEGYYVTQLWMLMNIFGHVMTMAHEIPFSLDIIITNRESVAQSEE